jgi:hypothetical protein
MTASTRLLWICVDDCFADEADFELLPALFSFAGEIGLIVPDLQAAASYRRTQKSLGWEKVYASG